MPKPQRFLSAGELNVAHARLKDLFSAKSTHGGRAQTRQIMALIRDVEEFTTGDVVPSDALRMARAMLLLGHPLSHSTALKAYFGSELSARHDQANVS